MGGPRRRLGVVVTLIAEVAAVVLLELLAATADLAAGGRRGNGVLAALAQGLDLVVGDGDAVVIAVVDQALAGQRGAAMVRLLEVLGGAGSRYRWRVGASDLGGVGGPAGGAEGRVV